MNLILTTTCNKNCSFCFARDKANSKLTLDDIKEIMAKIDQNVAIKLLGGEPTLHENFSEILNYFKDVENPITLISNFFIYKDEIKESIKKFQENKRLNFLLNVSEINEKQYNTVINNINQIIIGKTLSLGFTLDDTRDFISYKEWLEKFLKEGAKDKIYSIRTSVPFPNYKEGEEKKFYLYKNYKYIDLLIEFIKWGLQNEIKVSVDCGLFPCMIKDKETEDYLRMWVDDLKMGCTGSAFDVFSTDYVSLCYPGKDIHINLSRHSSVDEAHNELIMRKQYQYVSGQLPEECKNCEHFQKKCGGPCLGFVGIKPMEVVNGF